MAEHKGENLNQNEKISNASDCETLTSADLLEVPARQRNGKTAVTLCLLFLLVAAGLQYILAGHPSSGDPPARAYPIIANADTGNTGMDSTGAGVTGTDSTGAGHTPDGTAGGTEDRAAQAADWTTDDLSAIAAEETDFTDPTAPPEDSISPAAAALELPWNLILVNKDHPLPDNFSVPSRTTLSNGHSIDSRVYPYLEQMLSDARAAGGKPYILSSFRTLATQKRLFQNRIRRFQNDGYSRAAAEDAAGHWVAIPNTSEHQLGLALDIVDQAFQSLTSRQASTVTQQWLMEHCAEYGFVLRFPSSKIEITGIGYEPWHYRYVGVEAAREMTERGLCLEEYIALLTGESTGGS